MIFGFGVPKLSGREVYPYELITNISEQRCLENAQRILNSGWSVGKNPAVKLSRGTINWTLSDPQVRSWACALHCWNMMDVLLAAYSESGDPNYIKPCVDVALEWAELHQKKESISEFSWYDMAVGMRTYRLAYLIDSANHQRLLSKHQLRLLWKCLLKHTRHLSVNKNITYQNNHGYYQIAGQLAMGRRFAGLTNEFDEAYQLGLERLDRILTLHFTEEGVHKEHSPDYHRMVYETLKGLINAGLVSDPALIKRALQIERVLAWFIYPNGTLVNFGDSPSRDMLRPTDQAKIKWRTPEMQYVASSGQIGKFFLSKMASFPESGYWMVRDNNPELSEEQNSSYLAHAAAFHSRTHKHADDLNFVWFDKGVPILTDSGRFGYMGKTKKLSKLWNEGFWYSDPRRIYCETTRAHNTLEFDGQNFNRRGKPFGSAIKSWGEKDGVYYCWSQCTEFKSIVYDRFLIFKPGGWLWVIDNFVDVNNEKHDVRQIFNVSPLHNLIKNEQNFYIHLNKTDDESLTVLNVIPVGNSILEANQFFGDKDPEMRGWTSETDGYLKKSPAFEYVMRMKNKGRFRTFFTFSSEVEVFGPKVKGACEDLSDLLVWRDGENTYTLTFNANCIDGMSLSVSKQT